MKENRKYSCSKHSLSIPTRFKFDDDKVTPVTQKEAMDDNFGGEVLTKSGVKTFKRFTNAYMLVYVRNSDIDWILEPVTEEDIPSHLRKNMKWKVRDTSSNNFFTLEQRLMHEKQLSEVKKKEIEEQHLYFNIKVVTDEDIARHDAFDLCSFDDKNPTPAQLSHPILSMKVKKLDTFKHFKETLAEKLGLPFDGFRLWGMVSRQNRTVRPDCPIHEADYGKSKE